MRLSQALVVEFQELHLRMFGKHLSYEVAELDLLNLAELVRITQPIKTKENKND